MPDQEFTYIEKCLSLVEEKLNWGASENWKQRDFEALSEQIFLETKTQLSLSTLKRIWQKNFKKLPQPGTLNALVQFIGFKNWQDFKSQQNGSLQKHKEIPKTKPKQKKGKHWVKILYILLAIILAFVLIGLVSKFRRIDPDKIDFSVESISNDIPNTVIFRYDLAGIRSNDVQIQQSWDQNRREKIFANDSVHTSIYYYPGYFNTKLLINNKVIKEYPLRVSTDGWTALATETGYDEIPSYIPDEFIHSEGKLYVSPQTLKEYNVDLKEISHWVHFYNSRDFGQLNCNNFIFETSVRNSLDAGALTCQEAYVRIHFEDGRSVFPLAIPGCASNLILRFSEYYESGKNSDLSMFGCDMEEWQKLKVVAKNGNADIFLNDKLIKSVKYAYNSGKITYLQYRFKGCGEIDYVSLKDTTHTEIYFEDFE